MAVARISPAPSRAGGRDTRRWRRMTSCGCARGGACAAESGAWSGGAEPAGGGRRRRHVPVPGERGGAGGRPERAGPRGACGRTAPGRHRGGVTVWGGYNGLGRGR